MNRESRQRLRRARPILGEQTDQSHLPTGDHSSSSGSLEAEYLPAPSSYKRSYSSSPNSDFSDEGKITISTDDLRYN